MNNTFNPTVTWKEIDVELMSNGEHKYFATAGPGRPESAVILIRGVGNDKKLAFAGQTTNVGNYLRSGGVAVAKAQLTRSICGTCKIHVALERDVMNGNQPLPAGFFNNEHVRKAIAEKTNVEHLMDGYSIV